MSLRRLAVNSFALACRGRPFRKRFLWGFLVGCVLAAAPIARAQSDDPARLLLRRVAETYTNLKSYHFDATSTTLTRSGDHERKSEHRIVTAQDATGRSRVELDEPVMGGVVVFDGDTTWIYRLGPKHYIERQAASVTGGPAVVPGGSRLEGMQTHFVDRYRAVADRVESARVIDQQPLQLGDEMIECTVVEADYSPAPGVAKAELRRTFWIDPARSLILRESSVAKATSARNGQAIELSETLSFQVARGYEPIRNDLFVFVPPEGAQKVESFEAESERDEAMVGSPVPDFTLKDLDGKSHRLEDYRGKVVLLDFWATWCAPCRVDLPRIDALQQEWREKGLVVLGVNSEDPEIAREFIRQQAYAFSTLVDEDQQLSAVYDVKAIPTVVVIDGGGKISAYLVGSHPEEEIRQAVRKASLN